MTSPEREGAPSGERGGPGPRVAAVVPSDFAPEHPVLRAVRGNRLLDTVRHSDSAFQIRRTARLAGDLAAITSTLAMSFADLLFRTMSGDPVQLLQRRFSVALQAVDIINELCAQPLVLRDWFFSEEHCFLTTRLLGTFTGFAGVTVCAADPQTVYQTVSWPAILDEAPFLNTIFFLMVHRDLPPLALAQCLTRARFGYWSDDRRTFFTERQTGNQGQGLSIRWGLQTREANDLGTVWVSFEGENIASFRFTQAWPRARFRPGRHLMDKRFNLQELPPRDSAAAGLDGSLDRRTKIFKTARASDGLQHVVPPGRTGTVILER